MKRAIVSSFHSSTLAILREEAKAVISFDSHLDTYMPGGPEVLKALFELPFPLRGVCLRTNIHAILGPMLKGIPLYLVVPESCFLNHVDVDRREANLLQSSEKLTHGDVIEMLYTYLRRIGIELVLSPPANLKQLYKKVPKHKTIIDIDVDYMQEFQGCCYTKAPRLELDGTNVTHLGQLCDVMRTINKIRPDLVLISEVTFEQIRSNKPPLNALIAFLRNQGYAIEKGELVKSDESAFEALEIGERFAKEVLKPIRQKLSESENFMENFDKELAKELKKLSARDKKERDNEPKVASLTKRSS